MELFWIITVGILFTLAGLVCVALVAFGLPGTWILLGLASLVEVLDRFYLPDGRRQTFGWWLLAVCLLLAALGELLEFLAGALGARTGGSTKHGAVGAVLGGVAGAVAGLVVPVPLIGSLVLAAAGTFVGAVVGELLGGREKLEDTLTPATTATVGRILGALAKVPIAALVWVLLSVAAFWP